jgi:hypothetical protein
MRSGKGTRVDIQQYLIHPHGLGGARGTQFCARGFARRIATITGAHESCGLAPEGQRSTNIPVEDSSKDS